MSNVRQATWRIDSEFAGTAPTYKERITKDDGTQLLIAGITSLSYAIKRVAADGTKTTVESGSLTVADVWSDTWLYDDDWGTAAQTGSKGYNFRKRFAATNLTAVGNAVTNYEITVQGVLTDTTVFNVTTAKLQISPR